MSARLTLDTLRRRIAHDRYARPTGRSEAERWRDALRRFNVPNLLDLVEDAERTLLSLRFDLSERLRGERLIPNGRGGRVEGYLGKRWGIGPLGEGEALFYCDREADPGLPEHWFTEALEPDQGEPRVIRSPTYSTVFLAGNRFAFLDASGEIELPPASGAKPSDSG